MSLRNILLIGPTGHVGSAMVRAFLAQKEKFNTFGAVINPVSYADPEKKAKLTPLEQQGIQLVILDLTDNAAMTKAFRGWDVIISTLNAQELKLQNGIIDAAVAAGVKRFIPSEFGCDLSDSALRCEMFFSAKVGAQDHLRAVTKSTKSNPEFSYTLFYTGIFADFVFTPTPAFLDYDFFSRNITIVGDGNAEISWTSYDDCANLLVAVLLRPEDTKNATIKFHGQVATWNDVFKILEETQGALYNVTHQDIAEMHEREKRVWEAGSPMAAALALRRFLATGKGRIKDEDLMNHMFPEVQTTIDWRTLIKSKLVDSKIIS